VGREAQELLEKVAARDDEFGFELSTAVRVEREGKMGLDVKGPLDRFRCLDPVQTAACRNDGPEVGQRIEHKRPQLRDIAHAEAASLTS
jgi:hypothetical protein